MDDAKEKLRNKALTILTAIGDIVAGRTADGATYGDLDGVMGRRQIRRGPRIRWSKMPEMEPVLNLAAGQLVRVSLPQDVSASKFQSAICSIACNRWGKGNYTTVLNPDSVDVIRTA